MMDFKIKIDHLVELEWLDSADRHAHAVAEKVADVMVFHEERVLGKDRALLRFLDIGLERHQPFFSALIEKVIHGFKKLDVPLFGELRASEDSAHTRLNLFQNMELICDQH